MGKQNILWKRPSPESNMEKRTSEKSKERENRTHECSLKYDIDMAK
jgi:hypothetical protein